MGPILLYELSIFSPGVMWRYRRMKVCRICLVLDLLCRRMNVMKIMRFIVVVRVLRKRARRVGLYIRMLRRRIIVILTLRIARKGIIRKMKLLKRRVWNRLNRLMRRVVLR